MSAWDTTAPTWVKECECGTRIERWRGETHVECPDCKAQYNAAGQRLRDDWGRNPSNDDEDIGDLEGMEIMEARAETYESDRLDGMYFEPEYREE